MGYEHPKRYAESYPGSPRCHRRRYGRDTLLRRHGISVQQISHAFRSLGLGVGDHVAILMENRLEYFEAVWAGMRSGLFVTPINWHLSPDEVEYIIRDCGASVLVTSSACAALTQGAVADVNSRIVVGGSVEGFDSYERVLEAHSAVPGRRRVRRQLDVLFLGDDRTPEGHQATLCRRCAGRGVIVHRSGAGTVRR